MPSGPGGREALAALGPDAAAWGAAGAGAERAYALGRWAEAAPLYERRIALVPARAPGDDPRPDALSRFRDGDLYNLACCRALLGRKDAALDALEEALEKGFEIVGFEHLLEDPDLAPLHGEPRWEALVGDLSWNEVVAGHGWGPRAVPVVVSLDDRAEPVPGTMTVTPRAPYRVAPGRFAWTTRLDPGEQAARKVEFALERGLREGARDPARRILRAEGREHVRLAWEVLLRRPEAFTRAVLVGPAPPAWVLLDRGADRIRTEILVAGPEGVPAKEVGVTVRDCGSAASALREALR
jgi:tetratricopeptide (TPR) repeat protein